MTIDPQAGRPATPDKLINLACLLSDFYSLDAEAKVSFGTSGHRGSAFKGAFNESHVVAITAAVIEYRALKGHRGPLFLGHDTHALSEPAWRVALSVLAAAGTPVVISQGREYAPTPVISFLILEHNRTHPGAMADGLIMTPSHNPPQDGGIKYNPPNGGPADLDATGWIQERANELLADLASIKRLPFRKALQAGCVSVMDYVGPFVEALGQVVDLAVVKQSGLKIGADPLGGSGTRYWGPIAERWGLDLTVVNPRIDVGFSFMSLDYDGIIRMDCSSPYAMANLIRTGGSYDLGIGNDPDFDRHGIVSGGTLMNPNHYLATAIDYLLAHRPDWPAEAQIGKTLVSSTLIDRVVKGAGRRLYETPVGFKWFVQGLLDGGLGFGGEESAGASFLRRDGRAWTTDKCGFCMTLLAAEMSARTGRLPHEIYGGLTKKYGGTDYSRVDSELTEGHKAALGRIAPRSLVGSKLAGLDIIEAWDKAPGNQAPIGGLKVTLADGSWFAVRPSGTEPKMKLYAESLGGPGQLEAILKESRELLFGGS
ncbi:MAG: phosphoglucomutase, alpha-D-glucose phosphate-specific [Deltaproteobacteria bacterium]|jgi:phosphoglucomutase|nr:phosphoglucomutase, alpha-D-glucose phosphate-specific [Deltaproteobacteria bacterium]MDR1309010.1 phosphoglucomutase, alpha-D-glucose phosphate-specific [Deltaproteobacteria bacterium]